MSHKDSYPKSKGVTLVLSSDAGCEEFPNFMGQIPRVGEYVTFYMKEHDGCVYGGTVKRVTHRIEFQHQEKDCTVICQKTTVHLKGKLKWIL